MSNQQPPTNSSKNTFPMNMLNQQPQTNSSKNTFPMNMSNQQPQTNSSKNTFPMNMSNQQPPTNSSKNTFPMNMSNQQQQQTNASKNTSKNVSKNASKNASKNTFSMNLFNSNKNKSTRNTPNTQNAPNTPNTPNKQNAPNKQNTQNKQNASNGINMQNSGNTNIYNKSKNHFFIGYKLDNNTANQLKKIQGAFLKRYQINNVKKVRTFHIRFAYLGYINDEISISFYNYLTPLINAVINKFKPLDCNLLNLEFHGKNSVYNKIVLKFNNKFLDIIKKYLRKYGTDNVFGNSIDNISDLHINLITFNKSDNKNNLENIKKGAKEFKIYSSNFKINSLELLKGETTILRSGQPSKNDEMFIDQLEKYTKNFKGNL
jgi:hypothetical protein